MSGARNSPRRGVVWLLAIGSAAALALGVAACGGDDDSGGSSSSGGGGGGGDQITVGLITKTESNPFFVKMKQAAQKAADQNNAKLVSAAGKQDLDNQSQVTALENMTTQGVKGIMITPAVTKAIVPAMEKARAAGVIVIALDTPPEPQDAADALYATDNKKAGVLIGKYAKAYVEKKGIKPKIAMLDLGPGATVGQLRHDGFLEGFGIKDGDPQIVGAADTAGDRAKGQAAMEQLLQKDSGINVVYSINEPSGFGGATALKAAGKNPDDFLLVSVDGGCEAITKGIKPGIIDATSQQYPQNMAKLGVEAIVKAAKGGKKPSGGEYVDTGVNLITDEPMSGVDSKDSAFGEKNCWG
jgi:fructose transport system substrate-binding protein